MRPGPPLEQSRSLWLAEPITVKVHVHCAKANAKANFSLIFITSQREHLIGLSVNPFGSDVTFTFAFASRKTNPDNNE